MIQNFGKNLSKFRKIFKTADFENNLWKYVFQNFKSKCQENFEMEILRKYVVKVSLTTKDIFVGLRYMLFTQSTFY